MRGAGPGGDQHADVRRARPRALHDGEQRQALADAGAMQPERADPAAGAGSAGQPLVQTRRDPPCRAARDGEQQGRERLGQRRRRAVGGEGGSSGALIRQQPRPRPASAASVARHLARGRSTARPRRRAGRGRAVDRPWRRGRRAGGTAPVPGPTLPRHGRRASRQAHQKHRAARRARAAGRRASHLLGAGRAGRRA